MLPNISTLQNEFDLFIFDVYGVLWNGASMFPGTLELMEGLRRQGKIVIVMSNAAASWERLADEGHQRGYLPETHYNRIIAAGDIAKLVFSHDERPLRYYIYGHYSATIFDDSIYERVENPADADFIYFGFPVLVSDNKGCELCTSIAPFAAELDALQKLGKPAVCANPDYVARVGGYPQPIICEGSFGAYYEKIGGSVVWFGKPYADIYEHVLQDYPDIPRSRVLMLGDTLRTDIAGAKTAGIKSALLLTGISYEEMQQSGETDIKAFAEKSGIIPDYYLQSL